jgi:hypothetical protein
MEVEHIQPQVEAPELMRRHSLLQGGQNDLQWGAPCVSDDLYVSMMRNCATQGEGYCNATSASSAMDSVDSLVSRYCSYLEDMQRPLRAICICM